VPEFISLYLFHTQEAKDEVLVGWLMTSTHDLPDICYDMGSELSNIIVKVFQCQFVLSKFLFCSNDCLFCMPNIFMKKSVELECAISFAVFLKGNHFSCTNYCQEFGYPHGMLFGCDFFGTFIRVSSIHLHIMANHPIIFVDFRRTRIFMSVNRKLSIFPGNGDICMRSLSRTEASSEDFI
jgi:hypothetical protein